MQLLFKSIPFRKEDVTLALESGIDGIITEDAAAESVRHLALCDVYTETERPLFQLSAKADEQAAEQCLRSGGAPLLARGWEVIPVENLLAAVPSGTLGLEAGSLDEARLAAGILECGVSYTALLPEALPQLKAIVSELRLSQAPQTLQTARITEVRHAGLGHRVCVDTLSLLSRGQGMLIGNSSAFTFLVHAETEHNEYVAARPFRINSGGVHGYVILPGDRTCYAGELRAGDEVLIVSADGTTSLATAGRIKTEIRPMLMLSAETADGASGSIFLQNAETIRLTRPDHTPISVVDVRPGDEILCRTDSAGRHFGMRIQENIIES